MPHQPKIIAVCRSPKHRFSKDATLEIRLTAGMGVDGDAHSGLTVQHRYDKRRAPDRPNLRQVHLIDVALYDALRGAGFDLQYGALGENIVTHGIDMTALPCGTILHLGREVKIELTGLREPCVLIDRFRPGLRGAVEARDPGGRAYLRSGVMARVLVGGFIRPGDGVVADLPKEPHRPLDPV